MAMRITVAVLLVGALLSTAVQAAPTLSYNVRTSGTGSSLVTYLDILAAEGATNVWSMTVHLGRADNHAYWTKGEIASFKDLGWGGAAFDYSPESGTVASTGLFRGASMSTSETFSDAGGRLTDKYVFSYTTLFSGVNVTKTTTIYAPTITATVGSQVNWTSTIDTVITLVNNTGAAVDISGLTHTDQIALNNAGFTGWTILNPIVAGQPYPNVHANDSTDGMQLYSLVDWYGDKGGNHNDGHVIQFTVKDNADTATLNMRPGLQFSLVNDDVSMNYCLRTQAAIGATTNSGNDDLKGTLTNAREAYGTSIADQETLTYTTTMTISAPVPEPATMGLLGLGILGLMLRRRK